MWFYNAEGKLISLPAAWTSVGAEDPAVAIAKGRAAFRVQDLLELASFVRERLSNV